MSVCFSICLHVHWHIAERHVEILPNVLHVLTMAASRSSLTKMQYVMYFRFCGWRHISHN